MDSSLVSAGAGLIGALIGGGATLLGGALQHRRQVRADKETQRATNAEQAARRCDEIVREIRAMTETHMRTPYEQRNDTQYDRQLSLARHELDAQVLLLPLDFREALSPLVEILRNIAWISVRSPGGGTHYHSESAITYHVCRYFRATLAACLRWDTVPPQPTIIDEYIAALTDAATEQYEEFGTAAEYQWVVDATALFYRRHPEFEYTNDDPPKEVS